MAILQAPTSWYEKGIATFRASPGRSSIAGALVLVLAFAWGRVLRGGHSPATAQGSAVSSRTSVIQVAAMPPAPRYTAESDPSFQQWSRQPVHALSRNPFAIPFDFYPQEESGSASDSSGGSGYWDLVKKSMASRADQQEQRQILVDNVRIAAEALKLESTVLGAAPGAMVNGQLVREGSSVAGFHVIKIQPRRVIVEREGVKLAVSME